MAKSNDLIYLTDNFNNKLYCNNFSLLQPADSDRFVVGRIYHVYFKTGPRNAPKKFLVGTAQLKTSNEVAVEKLSDAMCLVESGYNAEKTRQMIHRMWKGKATIMFFGVFAWVDREPVTIPMRGEVGRTYKELKARIAQKKKSEQLSLLNKTED